MGLRLVVCPQQFDMKDVEIVEGTSPKEIYESRIMAYHKEGYVAVNELSKSHPYPSDPSVTCVQYLLLVIKKDKVKKSEWDCERECHTGKGVDLTEDDMTEL